MDDQHHQSAIGHRQSQVVASQRRKSKYHVGSCTYADETAVKARHTSNDDVESFFDKMNLNTKKKLIRQIKHYLDSDQSDNENQEDIVV